MTRLLFVLSNDYGELSNARYFVEGGPFDPLFLLPPRLYTANAGSLPVRHERYETPADVLAAAARERPGLVLLFSGYLYALNQLFDVEDLAGLLTGLRARGYPMVTSDPFLGILPRLDRTTFSDRHPQKRWLTEHFYGVLQLLRDVPRLDLVPVEDTSGVRRLSFFNAAILSPPADLGRHGLALDSSRPRWLFVLSLEDYSGQASELSRARFDHLLAERLREAVRAGAQPVLVAPEVAVRSLPPVEGAIVLPFCGHELFRALAADAEFAFYWNVLSNSIAGRVANRRPVFFFDAGHMVRSIPALHAAGMHAYYRGAELPYLDRTAPLNSPDLRALADRQDRDFAPAREAFRRSPSPAEVVARLIEDAGRSH